MLKVYRTQAKTTLTLYHLYLPLTHDQNHRLWPACPLCKSTKAAPYATVPPRDYFRCEDCDLVFLHPDQRPDAAAELAEYSLHENDPADAGYRKHLSKLLNPLMTATNKEACILDFGAGPGPAICVMLKERGHHVVNYDPYFAPDTTVLLQSYDLITCTEVAEHFYHPATEFARFDRLLRRGGKLGIMTRLRRQDIDFTTWWYIRETTHVCFYSARTMAFIAAHFGWQMELHHPDVAIFQKRV